MKNLNSLFYIVLAVLSVGVVGCGQTSTPNQSNDENPPAEKVASRQFEFNYGATIKDLPEGAQVRVWFPVAQSNGQQTVEQTSNKTPGEISTQEDVKYGNKIGYFEAKSDASPLEFSISYDVKRLESSVDGAAKELTKSQRELFLSANSLVPVDGKPQQEFKDVEVPTESMEAGKTLYNLVEDHMKYDKSQAGYGNGDAAWACDSKTGNCTDFHSLFISLARSNNIPARFEIGFPLPGDKTEGEIGGYHCWAWFFAEGSGWAPVDISEADKHPEMKDYYFGKLTADRIAFSKGRDIELVPKAESGLLNYFVYPHVEVDGKLWPKDMIELNFSFKDKQQEK